MHCTRRRIACTTHTCHLWPLVRSPVVLRPVGPADIGEWQPWRELLTLRRSLAELVAEARRHVLHAGTCARRRPPSCGGVDIPWRPMMHANAVMQSARAHLLGFHRWCGSAQDISLNPRMRDILCSYPITSVPPYEVTLSDIRLPDKVTSYHPRSVLIRG